MRRSVLVDSSAYYALANARDTNHTRALTISRRLMAESRTLITTIYVVAESHGLILNRAGHEKAVRFLRSFETSDTHILRPSHDDEDEARRIIYHFTDKDFSLTDAISFAVMARLQVGTAFTFDSDFTRYGFDAARP